MYIPLSVWAIFTFIVVLTTFSRTIIEGYHIRPRTDISDPGARYAASPITPIASTICSLLDCIAAYAMYELMKFRANEKGLCGPHCQKLLLAIKWMTYMGKLLTTLLPESFVRDTIVIAVLLLSASSSTISMAIPLCAASRDHKCMRATNTVLNVTISLANISRLALRIAEVFSCTSDYCTQSSKLALRTLEWLVVSGSSINYLLLFWDFQVLTIQMEKNTREACTV
ncbi:uncharacterized protein [Dendropsophus ebraccatus]|uniref:uncharacterized protein n=1 Tax=Dendropsophus ebraccatus TaxID=150705 RepID=UPI00383117D7